MCHHFSLVASACNNNSTEEIAVINLPLATRLWQFSANIFVIIVCYRAIFIAITANVIIVSFSKKTVYSHRISWQSNNINLNMLSFPIKNIIWKRLNDYGVKLSSKINRKKQQFPTHNRLHIHKKSTACWNKCRLSYSLTCANGINISANRKYFLCDHENERWFIANAIIIYSLFVWSFFLARLGFCLPKIQLLIIHSFVSFVVIIFFWSNYIDFHAFHLRNAFSMSRRY